MNNIQSYGVSENSSGFQQKNYNIQNKINFRALHMPTKDEFIKLGKESYKELERVRPTIEQIAKEHSDVECFVEPRKYFGGNLQIAATCREGKAHFPLNVNNEIEYAKQVSKSFGEHIVELLKGAIEYAKNGAI